MLDDVKKRVQAANKLFSDIQAAMDIKGLEERLKGLQASQASEGFYSDTKKAAAVGSEIASLQKRLEGVKRLNSQLVDIKEFTELGEEGLAQDIEKSLSEAEKVLDGLYLQTLLKGEYDKNNAILSLHAGAGGTEAQDWAEMLYRMYKMYASQNGFKVQELDYLAGDGAGIKSVSFLVSGENSYGYLKAEKGVHRLVRISPFDSNARRHTSFASLEVMPEIENDLAVKIDESELKIDTYRAGGSGGQHVNKTDSAVRITHLPSGIVVQCQNERSQLQNKETALKMLRGKLVEKKERENLEKAENISGELKKIEWGSQIRSYVFQPYTMAKDHRTNFECSDIQAVMNGKIEGFIFEWLRRC